MRCIFPLIFLSLSSGICFAQADRAPQRKVSITTELPSYKEHKANLMADGKKDTFFWIPRGVKKGETITLSTNLPLPTGKTLIVRDGKPDGKDRFSGAVLEGSLDGRNWKILGEHRGGLLTAKLPRPLKHLRLRASRDVPHWIAIREIEMTDKASPVRVVRSKVSHKGKTYPLSIASNLEGFADLTPRFEEMAKLYFVIWPKLVDMLGSPPAETHLDVDIQYRKDMDHPAHASGKTITISAAHLRRDPEDTRGVFVHELTHVIQRYPSYQPSWFIEGSADYTRFKLSTTDRWAQRCRRHVNHQKPFGHYWSSAAFLLYLEETYKKPVTRVVSQSIRAKTYNEAIWKQLTGKNLQQLAEDYKVSKWKPAQPTAEK
ncbi:MAG: basic secretory protein-like protein [Akkermansiaceae bacterium]